jgi:hypothetical protein
MQTTLTLLVCAPTTVDRQHATENTNVSQSYCQQYAQQFAYLNSWLIQSASRQSIPTLKDGLSPKTYKDKQNKFNLMGCHTTKKWTSETYVNIMAHGSSVACGYNK